MIKVSDVHSILCYHFNTDEIDIYQVMDRDGNDIQIWSSKDTIYNLDNDRVIEGDYKIPFDCMMVLLVDGDYHDIELDDIIISHMNQFLRDIKIKSLLS